MVDLADFLTSIVHYSSVVRWATVQNTVHSSSRASLQEPEVVDLADFLTSCGAHIRGAGTNTLSIRGVARLGAAEEFSIIPDRIEAGTFLAAAAVTRSTISLAPVVPRHLTAVICKLREMGCRVQQTHIETLTVSDSRRPLPIADVSAAS